jgi:hypothetical protein
MDAASDTGATGSDAGSEAGLDAASPDASDAALDAASTDAGSTDAGSDATTPDASVQTFTLTVRRGKSQALPQAPVFFHGENGALLAEHTTGADGRVVSSSVPSMLTVIVPKSGNVTTPIQSPQLFTITQIVAGDELVLELPADVPAPAPAPQPGYSISFANGSPVPTNTTLVAAYGGELSCAFATSDPPFTPPLALAWPQGCGVQSANTLLAVAYQQISATRIDAIGYAFAKGVPAFGNAPQAVTLGAWMAKGTTQATVQNVPNNADVEGKLLLYSEGASFDPTGKLVSDFPKSGTTRSLSIPTPVGFAAEQALLVNVSVQGAPKVNSLATRGAPAATQTLDMATGLPGAASGTITATNPARLVANWTMATTPANSADGTVAYFEWGAEPSATPWLVIAPTGVTTVTLPEVPASQRAFQVGAAHLYLSHFGSSKQQGYRDFLKEPLRPTLSNSYHPLARELTPDTSLQAISIAAQ